MDSVPKKIKDLTVGEHIGDGAYGSVYFGERGGKTYAVKFEPRAQTQLTIEIEVNS